jgi:malonyl-CoA O-methyltransferase
MWQTIHNKIRRSFSDAALNYEILSSLHKEIGRELIRKVIDQPCARILDVGTGTGYLANKAKFYFPEAMVVGIDLADGMVLEANKLKEGIQIVQADACALPFPKGAFDLIVSNLAYQWVADLPHAFRQSHRCLSDSGVLCATVFGRQTLNEFYEAIHSTGSQKEFLNRLPDMEILKASLLSAGFKSVDVDYEIIKVQFSDVMDLLKWIKGIGANILNDDVFLGRQLIARMDEYYKSKYPYFDGICVTFEIIWVRAQK